MNDQTKTATQSSANPPACIDCQHFMDALPKEHPKCTAMPSRKFDIVFGLQDERCSYARRPHQACGPEGRLFLAAQATDRNAFYRACVEKGSGSTKHCASTSQEEPREPQKLSYEGSGSPSRINRSSLSIMNRASDDSSASTAASTDGGTDSPYTE